MIAFLARYAHQPVEQLMQRTVTDLTIFAEEIGKLIEEEHKAAKAETDG